MRVHLKITPPAQTTPLLGEGGVRGGLLSMITSIFNLLTGLILDRPDRTLHNSKQQGSIIIAAIVFLMVVTAAAAGISKLTFSSAVVSTERVDSERAFYAAESARLMSQDLGDDELLELQEGLYAKKNPVGAYPNCGSYDLFIGWVGEDSEDWNNTRARHALCLEPEGGNFPIDFGDLFFGGDSPDGYSIATRDGDVTISGSSVAQGDVWSCNSIQLGSGNVKAIQGNVRSGGNVSITGSTSIGGNVKADGDIDLAWSTNIDGDARARGAVNEANHQQGNVAGTVSEYDASITPVDCSDNTQFTGIDTDILDDLCDSLDDTYNTPWGHDPIIRDDCYNSIQLTANRNAQVNVDDEPRVIHTRSLNIQQGHFHVDTPSDSPLVIVVEDSFSMGGSSTFNQSGNTHNLIIYYRGTNDIDLTGNVDFNGLLIAPNAHVNLGGSSESIGYVEAESVAGSGNVDFLSAAGSREELQNLYSGNGDGGGSWSYAR